MCSLVTRTFVLDNADLVDINTSAGNPQLKVHPPIDRNSCSKTIRALITQSRAHTQAYASLLCCILFVLISLPALGGPGEDALRRLGVEIEPKVTVAGKSYSRNELIKTFADVAI